MTLYLYAIVDETPAGPLGEGVFGGPISLVRVGRHHVVVEQAPRGEAPAIAQKELASMVTHDRVVRRVARLVSGRAPAVLPLRFGSAVATRADLARLLRPYAKDISRALDRVRGAVQFTLRVTGEPAPARRLPRGGGPGTRWLTARAEAQRVPEIEALTQATRPFVREARAERHRRPPLLASVYHLVPREDVRRWRAAVRRSTAELGVKITLSGPWPPYAFAELA